MITINAKHRRRLLLMTVFLLGIAAAIALILRGLSDNINLFYTPSELHTATLPPKTIIRVGGMVMPGTVQRAPELRVSFQITDYESNLTIDYKGILPDLFREGQGVVVQGYLTSKDHFLAQEVLAKHDEKYMPPELKPLQKKLQNREN